jgi:hypothetical protein
MNSSAVKIKRPALSEKDDRYLRDLCVRVKKNRGQGDVTSMYHSLLFTIDVHTDNREVSINAS